MIDVIVCVIRAGDVLAAVEPDADRDAPVGTLPVRAAPPLGPPGVAGSVAVVVVVSQG